MKCPNCSAKTKTVDTRQYVEPDGDFFWVARRTKCDGCGLITKTVEVPQETWTKVFEFYNRHNSN
jgi:transcriptional regulator NrdR family protein